MPEMAWERRRRRNMSREVAEAKSCSTLQAWGQFSIGRWKWKMDAERVGENHGSD